MKFFQKLAEYAFLGNPLSNEREHSFSILHRIVASETAAARQLARRNPGGFTVTAPIIEICLYCDAPALPSEEFCEDCYEAVSAPEPTCSECGEELSAEDVDAGETTCLACAGAELQVEIEQISPLLAVVRARLAGEDKTR